MTPADLLIVGAPVWTGDPARPWAEAVAVRDQRPIDCSDGHSTSASQVRPPRSQ